MDLPTTRHDKSVSEPLEQKRAPEVTKVVTSSSEKMSFYVFLATLFLAPLFFIPSTFAPLDVIKTAVIGIGVLVAVIICIIGKIRNKELFIPRGPLALASLAVIVSLIVSAFLSANPGKSFFGQGFEIGTVSFLVLMFLVSFFIGKLTEKNGERIFSIYAAIFAAFIILALFHLARIVGGVDFMSFGVLSTMTSTVIGKWYDFAILTALIAFLSFAGIRFLTLGKGMKILLTIVFIVSGLLLFAINAAVIWWSLAIAFLALGIYEFTSRQSKGEGMSRFFSRISLFTLIILVISVLLAWKGGTIATGTTSALKLEYGELVLPWQMTLDVTADTIKEKPLFGAGPNRFGAQFLKFKPDGINPTQFWTAEFNSGFGTLPTFVATQGVLGSLAWLVFFIFFIKCGMTALKRVIDPFKKFSLISSFFGSLFLWIINFLYVPSHVILFITFVMTGIFFASCAQEGLMAYRELGSKQGRSRTYATVLSIIALVIALFWLGSYVKNTFAVAYFQSGLKEMNTTRNIEMAQAKFKKALFWNTLDVYYQALSETDIVKVNALAQDIQTKATQSGTQPDAKAVQQVSDLVTEALNYTQKGIALDPTNYYNYVEQARVLEIATSLKIPNAYENTKVAYGKAVAANPSNPALFLNLARLEASQNHANEAQQYIGRALQLKSNYLDAVFLLAQIQAASGQIKDAIVSSQVATQINPKEPLLFFQLGFLYYSDKNYTDAATTLAKAVDLNSDYANARYFLGLSYSRLGKNAEAIAQFEAIQKTNPDSQEVAFILANLKSGKSPFTDAVPPIDSKPEKRKTLPIKDKSAETAPTTETKAKTAK